ncbi:DNA polymerase IV [hydrothermal vent metagenome]|uniref:DNA polymerase IV n=1 Tax=hydrothermal vent metagenome TaxID=652676 RepID=A0A1W1C7G8_9ZZZZ
MFLHIDIDSFFASAERSIDPSLKGIPIAVGSRSNLEIFNKKRTNIRVINDNSGAFVTPVFYSDRRKSFKSYFIDIIDGKQKIRGIITTASYEARKCGVKTAMPIAQALQLCPEMVVVPSNYPLYHKLSYKIHDFMKKEIPKIEQFSIDEFFGDVSGWIEDEECYSFAQELKANMMKKFDIPVSIGISRAKWIAKLATESAKPFGIYEVKDIDAYIENIPIEAFPGIGKGFQKRLEKRYIKTLGDVKQNKTLFYSWKKPGIQLYHRVTGTCNEGIENRGARKSIGISRTFDPINDTDEIRRRIMIMARHITFLVMQIGVNPTTFYLKLNYGYGIKVKQSETINRLFSEHLLKSKLITMYDNIKLSHNGAVKITINLSNFTSHHRKTLSLLSHAEDTKEKRLSMNIHELRERFGLDILKTGNEL